MRLIIREILSIFLARMNATGKKSQHRTYYTDLDVLEKGERVITADAN